MSDQPRIVIVPKTIRVDDAVEILRHALKMELLEPGEFHPGWILVPEGVAVQVDRDGKVRQ